MAWVYGEDGVIALRLLVFWVNDLWWVGAGPFLAPSCAREPAREGMGELVGWSAQVVS